jgi:hypothetical protein
MVAEKAHRVCQSTLADVRSLQRDVAVGGIEMRAEESRLARLPRAGDQRRRKALDSLLQEPGKSARKQHGHSLTFADRKFNLRSAKLRDESPAPSTPLEIVADILFEVKTATSRRRIAVVR